MQQRSISAVGVVAAAIVPVLFGGPVWATAIAIFALIGIFEFNRIATTLRLVPLNVGYVVVVGACLIAAARWPSDLLILPLGGAVIATAILALRHNNAERSFLALAVDLFGTFWLTIPAVLAITTRQMPGSITTGWLDSTASALSLGWQAAPRGLAWMLMIITVTWLSDTGAYLVGRSIGKTPMVPAISPKKTREGLAGGVVAGMAFGLLANWLFGLDLPFLAAAGVSAILVVSGVIGDLTESLIKRQAGVKDSGTLIPGHGGILDRIDALLFTWTVGYFLARFCDRFWA
ncbi:MAG TPA: phosphatidate cytidylyltransferase [Thermomicrobiales bacterium]|nr:phosphatidate cytidylyltransferase [Thermomicrobiales bacterium]